MVKRFSCKLAKEVRNKLEQAAGKEPKTGRASGSRPAHLNNIDRLPPGKDEPKWLERLNVLGTIYFKPASIMCEQKQNQITTNYIEPFFVGLLEGDGVIAVVKFRNSIKCKFSIQLAWLPENENMLERIVKHMGGKIYYRQARGSVEWRTSSKEDLNRCLNILDKYPPLTSRKICQLAYLKQCIKYNTLDYLLKTRDSKYDQQKQIIEHNKHNFVLPPYFAPWLSGFVEAEGCFRPPRAFRIGQDNDWYILNAIKTYFDSHHKLGINKDSRSKSTQYQISMYGKPTLKRIVQHFDRYPLLGYKKVSYEVFCNLLSKRE